VRTVKGISLIELMLVIAILSLLMLLSGPSVVHMRHSIVHNSVANSIEHFLNQARITALSKNIPVTVSISQASPWCLGATENASCDCNLELDCVVNDTELVFTAPDYDHLKLTNLTLAQESTLIFSARLGTAYGANGSFLLSSPVATTRTVISSLGRTRTCLLSGNLSGQEPC